MPHHLIAGMTTCGKSALAKMLARRYVRNRFTVLVLDPLQAPDWPGTVTADPSAFMYYAKRVPNLRLFVDEGAASLGRDVDFNWLATQARHWGHRSHFLSQRPQDFTPQIRGNCHHLWLFGLDGKACELLAREWNKPELAACADLPRLQFKYAVRFAEVRGGRVDFQTDSIVWDSAPAAPAAAGGSLRDSTPAAAVRPSSRHTRRKRKPPR
jgi:hypothetical protein